MDECAPGGYPAPAGYEQPPSGWTSVRPEGTQPLPATNSRRPDGRVCARRVPSPCRLRTAAVRMDVCAPGGYPAPAGYDSRRPDGRVSAPQRRPARQHNTPSGCTGEQEPGGPGHRTRETTHRAGTPVNRSQGAQDTAHAEQHTTGTPVNRSQVAQDAAHAKQHTERAHR